MKIAIGVPNNLDAPYWNGFITAFRDIHRALDSHERIVFAPSGGDIKLEAPIQDPGDLFNQYNNTLALSKEFAEKVGKTNPDAILAFTGMGLFLSKPHVYYTSNVPYKKVVELIKGEYPASDHFDRLFKYYQFVADNERKNYEKAKKIIVLSRKIQELLISEHGIEKEKIAYIPRPIPKLCKDSDKKEPQKIRIIFMPGGLRVMKGIRYAIETMKILKKTTPNAVLVVSGRLNNYEHEYLKSLIKEAKGKANIILAGFLPKDEFHKYLETADCAFMPFCFDECPISLRECIGHGLPVVTNEYAGYGKEVIDTFGYCARCKDIDDYAEGLARMLTDEKFRQKKIDGAKEAVKKFDFASYKEAVNDVFREA